MKTLALLIVVGVSYILYQNRKSNLKDRFLFPYQKFALFTYEDAITFLVENKPTVPYEKAAI